MQSQSQDSVLLSDCDTHENACSQMSSDRVCALQSIHNHALCGGHRTARPSHPWCTHHGHPSNLLHSLHTCVLSLWFQLTRGCETNRGVWRSALPYGQAQIWCGNSRVFLCSNNVGQSITECVTARCHCFHHIRRLLALSGLMIGILLSCCFVNEKCYQSREIVLLTSCVLEPRNKLL